MYLRLAIWTTVLFCGANTSLVNSIYWQTCAIPSICAILWRETKGENGYLSCCMFRRNTTRWVTDMHMKIAGMGILNMSDVLWHVDPEAQRYLSISILIILMPYRAIPTVRRVDELRFTAALLRHVCSSLTMLHIDLFWLTYSASGKLLNFLSLETIRCVAWN